MRPAPTSTPDPALRRLREVAERIRQRAAAGRQRPYGPRPVRAPAPVPGHSSVPPPPHWSDDPDDERH